MLLARILKHGLYSGEELGGCMIAMSCTSSLLSASAMLSLDFGVNLSTHKIQLLGEPDLQQQY